MAVKVGKLIKPAEIAVIVALAVGGFVYGFRRFTLRMTWTDRAWREAEVDDFES